MRICPHCERKTEEKLCPHDGYQTVDASAYEADKKDPFLGKEFEGRYPPSFRDQDDPNPLMII